MNAAWGEAARLAAAIQCKRAVRAARAAFLVRRDSCKATRFQAALSLSPSPSLSPSLSPCLSPSLSPFLSPSPSLRVSLRLSLSLRLSSSLSPSLSLSLPLSPSLSLSLPLSSSLSLSLPLHVSPAFSLSLSLSLICFFFFFLSFFFFLFLSVFFFLLFFILFSLLFLSLYLPEAAFACRLLPKPPAAHGPGAGSHAAGTVVGEPSGCPTRELPACSCGSRGEGFKGTSGFWRARKFG